MVALPSFISSSGRYVSAFVKSSLISLYGVFAFSITTGRTNIFIILMTFSNELDKNEIEGLSDWNETKNSWNKNAINLKKCTLAVTVTSKWYLTNVSYDLRLSFGLLLTGKLSQCLIILTIFCVYSPSIWQCKVSVHG